jgi:drug/metabolite transporter (DMT)-like permease
VRSRVISQIAAVAIAAMGGAFAVYGGYDDSPGGTLLGILLVIGAAVFAGRAARRGS